VAENLGVGEGQKAGWSEVEKGGFVWSDERTETKEEIGGEKKKTYFMEVSGIAHCFGETKKAAKLNRTEKEAGGAKTRGGRKERPQA